MPRNGLKRFHLFSQLFVEIRELIYRQAFEDSERRATHLALVCREANFWINPLVYANLTFDCESDIDGIRFLLFVRQFYHEANTKPRSFYTDHVKSIFINQLSVANFAFDFLPLCKNLYSLVLRPPPNCSRNLTILQQILTPTNFPKLRKLHLSSDCHPQNFRTFSHPIYHNLTHLDIGADAGIPWRGFEALANLTHIVYGEFRLISEDVRVAAHELKTLIHQAAPHFPPKLKCFIINLPTDIIYGAACMHDQSEERLIYDDIVTGRMDQRVVMALWGGFQDPEVSDVGREMLITHPNPREEFLRYVSPLPMSDFATWIYMSLPEGMMDFWDEAEYRIHIRRGNTAPPE